MARRRIEYCAWGVPPQFVLPQCAYWDPSDGVQTRIGAVAASIARKAGGGLFCFNCRQDGVKVDTGGRALSFTYELSFGHSTPGGGVTPAARCWIELEAEAEHDSAD